MCSGVAMRDMGQLPPPHFSPKMVLVFLRIKEEMNGIFSLWALGRNGKSKGSYKFLH